MVPINSLIICPGTRRGAIVFLYDVLFLSVQCTFFPKSAPSVQLNAWPDQWSILCNFILLLHHISEKNIVLYVLLHLSDYLVTLHIYIHFILYSILFHIYYIPFLYFNFCTILCLLSLIFFSLFIHIV